MSKRQIYRHPVTNKFISKKEWEFLQPKEEVKDDIQLEGSDFDVDSKYFEDIKKFVKKIEDEFDNITKSIEEHKEVIKEEVKEVEENPSGWKLFYNKLKFWL
jgi:archaellum component FlaC